MAYKLSHHLIDITLEIEKKYDLKVSAGDESGNPINDSIHAYFKKYPKHNCLKSPISKSIALLMGTKAMYHVLKDSKERGRLEVEVEELLETQLNICKMFATLIDEWYSAWFYGKYGKNREEQADEN